MSQDDGFGFDPELLQINRMPLQRPGRDRCIRSVTVAGPRKPADRSLVLSVDILAKLLDIARTSVTRRVEVPRVGVRIDLYQRPDGTTHEVWTFLGGDPRPERPAVLNSLLAGS